MANVTKEASEVGTISEKNLGINWNYAPVADSTPDTSSFIYGRNFVLRSHWQLQTILRM